MMFPNIEIMKNAKTQEIKIIKISQMNGKIDRLDDKLSRWKS
jgi:hypothetical protein